VTQKQPCGRQLTAVRPVTALLAFALLATTAHAQNAPVPSGTRDDPAIAACDTVIRHEFPVSEVKRLSAEVAKDRVNIAFSTAASAMIFTRECVFALDTATRTWTVSELVSPRDAHDFEASGSCHETENWAGVLRRGGKPDQADLERARLEECVRLMQAAPDRKAEVIRENARRAARAATPVAANGTALRLP
jgi:hypothetical protein